MANATNTLIEDLCTGMYREVVLLRIISSLGQEFERHNDVGSFGVEHKSKNLHLVERLNGLWATEVNLKQ